MKKFECKECKNNCILTVEEHDMKLRLCPYSSFPLYAGWHEVVDSAENEQTTIEQPSNARQLPDWVKVGAVVFNEGYDYAEITDIREHVNGMPMVEFKEFNSNCKVTYSLPLVKESFKQARKRPFNADEMKDSVGKVLRGDKFDFCALITYAEAETIETQHFTYTSDELINDYTIDGKPCYVLEHLENGEWVK